MKFRNLHFHRKRNKSPKVNNYWKQKFLITSKGGTSKRGAVQRRGRGEVSIPRFLISNETGNDYVECTAERQH